MNREDLACSLHTRLTQEPEYPELTCPGVDPPFTEKLLSALGMLSQADLRDFFGISEKLGQTVNEYYPYEGELYPAWCWYTGEAFKYLDLPSLMKSLPLKANRTIRILSALYGMVSPMDTIQPYRLDFTLGQVPGFDGSASLRQLWSSRVTESLNKSVQDVQASFVLGAASQEYESLVDPGRLHAPFIRAEFVQSHPRTGLPTRISARAKQARGMLARWVVQQDITPGSHGGELRDFFQDFTLDGYRMESWDKPKEGFWVVTYIQTSSG